MSVEKLTPNGNSGQLYNQLGSTRIVLLDRYATETNFRVVFRKDQLYGGDMTTNISMVIYWLTVFLNLGPLGSVINDLTTGILDADLAEQIEVIVTSIGVF